MTRVAKSQSDRKRWRDHNQTMKLLCALVGTPGSTFAVEVDEREYVADLKEAILEAVPREIMCDADELVLYLAKKGNAWLTSRDTAAVLLDGLGHAWGFMKMDPARFIQNSEYFGENFTPNEGEVHALVVVPSKVSCQGVNCDKFNTPFTLGAARTFGGFPHSFQTYRAATVEAFYRLIFPAEGQLALPLLFFHAPPMSGKTALSQLLHNHIVRCKPDALVAIVTANTMEPDETFAAHFQQLYGCEFDSFCDLKCDRVVLIDSAQYLFEDKHFWCGYVKDAIEARLPRLRFVIFSTYSVSGICTTGMDFCIPSHLIFRLKATDTKPGLHLSRDELDEMVRGSIGESVSDLIWILCGRHIGMARLMLEFLSDKCDPHTSAEELALALCSADLLVFIRDRSRGVPLKWNLLKLIRIHQLSEDEAASLFQVMDDVSMGKIIKELDQDYSPAMREAVTLLVRFWFLHEDEQQHIQFASNLHLKIWLHSARLDPIDSMAVDVSQPAFVVECVQGLRVSRLLMANGSASHVARQRQVLMELYTAVVSCVPRDVLVSPEWCASSGNDSVDLVVRGSNDLWLWELLVDGDDEGNSHNYTKQRLTIGGSRHDEVQPRYVRIDFRSTQTLQQSKQRGPVTVAVVDSFTKARIVGLGDDQVTVELAS